MLFWGSVFSPSLSIFLGTLWMILKSLYLSWSLRTCISLLALPTSLESKEKALPKYPASAVNGDGVFAESKIATIKQFLCATLYYLGLLSWIQKFQDI